MNCHNNPFINESHTGQRRLTLKVSETTSKSLSLSASPSVFPPPTQRHTRARASSNLSPSDSFGIKFRIYKTKPQLLNKFVRVGKGKQFCIKHIHNKIGTKNRLVVVSIVVSQAFSLC